MYNSVPWQRPELDDWAIVGMNHYHVDGRRRLFVSMAKNGRCIKVEGVDTASLWDDLAFLATKQN